MKVSKFAPKEIFDQMLEWGVIPTFDLIIEFEEGILILKRTIAPYRNQWALPGLRMYKGEELDDTISRIALKEIGVKPNINDKRIIGQFVGKFKTEHQRQDISTCYLIKIRDKLEIKFNREHFSAYRIIKNESEIPANIGAMYKYYLSKYFRGDNA